DGSLRNALGLVLTRASWAGGPLPAVVAAEAADHFRRAAETEPGHLVARLNLAEALTVAGRRDEAADEARHALGMLNAAEWEGGDGPSWADSGHFPPAVDLFRVEWERAAWENAGRPAAEAQAKFALLRWRLHALLASLTGDLTHFYE